MIENCFCPAWQSRGKTVTKWGKDQTGLIEYQINQQGFRSPTDYLQKPNWAFFGNSIVFGVGVPWSQTLVSHFESAHNYGLAGDYMNHHSVTNLQRFLDSALYSPTTKIVFFWSDRNEPIDHMINQITQWVPGALHVSAGQKRPGAINLLPQIDTDVSGTHPGPKSHTIWAKTLKAFFNKKNYQSNQQHLSIE